jgi:hypothetical protein
MTLAITLVLPLQAQTSSRFFPETGHSLSGSFRAFWERNGALAVFGYPLSDELTEPDLNTGTILTTQYVERQRFEHHPENRGTPYEVQLGRLGEEALLRQGRDWFTFPQADPSTPHYFTETGHAIAPQFWDYWRTHGLDLRDRGISLRESLALWGFPLSEAQMELGSDGNMYLTQWFERARFEFHPNNPNPFKVLLGLLGAETMGFHTTQKLMLSAKGNASAYPIISSGDRLPNGYQFQGIPDGIGLVARGQDTFDAYVAHETSTVPFPAIGQTGAAADSRNAEISRVRLSLQTMSVVSGELVWKSELNFARFCSANMAGQREGFQSRVFFTGEETNDLLSTPPNPAWPATGATRQAGYVVAVDTNTGKQYVIPGLGRANHENTVVIPGGWSQVVALTDDDTFNAPSAQLYLYAAASSQDMLDDKGQLYAFVSDNATINDYGDLPKGLSVSGSFIAVPRDVALGDQTALENWSNANNVFQFIRTEDLTYDKNNPRVVYIADTGEPRAIADPTTGRLKRGASTDRGPYPNGRIFKMVMNESDPLKVDSLEVLIDADAAGYNSLNTLHNPDNLDTSANSLMIQEDPIGVNNFDPGKGPAARIWRYDLSNGSLGVVAEVDQSLDPNARMGTWESSGIVDASTVLGPDLWLVNVQAHSLWVEKSAQPEGYTRKLEGGQLILLRVPGS